MAKYAKFCKYCGKPFETDDGRRLYCDECSGTLKIRNAYIRQYSSDRRQGDEIYREKIRLSSERNRKKMQDKMYHEIAVELSKHCGDVEAIVEVLRRRCQLRHK